MPEKDLTLYYVTFPDWTVRLGLERALDLCDRLNRVKSGVWRVMTREEFDRWEVERKQKS